MLDFQSQTLDADKAKVQQDVATGANSDADVAQYRDDLKHMSGLEQTFWEKKVGEDNHWHQTGGGDAAQAALDSDNSALNNFRNESTDSPYLEEGSIDSLINDATTAPAPMNPNAPVPTESQTVANSGGALSQSATSNLYHNLGLPPSP